MMDLVNIRFFTNPETADLLRERNIRLVGYEQLRALTAGALGWQS